MNKTELSLNCDINLASILKALHYSVKVVLVTPTKADFIVSRTESTSKIFEIYQDNPNATLVPPMRFLNARFELLRQISNLKGEERFK